jgi:osmoprotectant transport system substrate-binding protein
MKMTIKRWALVSVFLLGIILVAIPLNKIKIDRKVIIGGKNFTEQYLLAEMAKTLMENNGFVVELKTGVGSSVIRQSLLKDQIDLYYEYTGTAYTVYYNQSDTDIMTNRDMCYEWIREADAEKGLVWLETVHFNNSYTLMMRKGHADQLGISSISDLSRYINKYPEKLLIGVNAEFWERPDGFKALMKHYDFEVPYNSIIKMESGLAYKALKEEQVSVSMGFETDGRIEAFGFINLEDDKSFFPVYNPAPVIRKNTLDKHPEIREILKPIAEHLTTQEMRKLNAEVDIEHKQVEDAAVNWLKNKELL